MSDINWKISGCLMTWTKKYKVIHTTNQHIPLHKNKLRHRLLDKMKKLGEVK